MIQTKLDLSELSDEESGFSGCRTVINIKSSALPFEENDWYHYCTILAPFLSDLTLDPLEMGVKTSAKIIGLFRGGFQGEGVP